MVDPIETSLTAEQLFEKPTFTLDNTPYWPGESDSESDTEWWQEYADMPRGKYFVGDPCHVIEDYYDLTDQNEITDVEGIGRVFWVSLDGLEQATDSNTTYCCDSMAIGMIPVDHLTPEHWAALKKLGRLIEWKTVTHFLMMKMRTGSGRPLLELIMQAMSFSAMIGGSPGNSSIATDFPNPSIT